MLRISQLFSIRTIPSVFRENLQNQPEGKRKQQKVQGKERSDQKKSERK